MSYKQNAAANREALFGAPKKSGGGGYKQNAASNRDELFGGGGGRKPAASSSSRPSSRPTPSSSAERPSSKPSATASNNNSSSSGYMYGVKTSYGQSKKPSRPTLSGEARLLKLKEAEEHRKQAKKCMARGVFAKPDPVAASMYYKRAADAYQQCGEARLERIHRVAGADCQLRQDAYATAAAEYMRAAELVQESTDDLTLTERRNEGSSLYAQAANAFTQMGEAAKAGKCRIQSAMALAWEDDSGVLEKRTLTLLEEAIEGFVPDLLNRNARYRQTGISAFVDPNNATEEPTKDDLALARQHMVTTSYAHEPLLDLVWFFMQSREFASALYAAGAACAILESDGISTLSLARVYVVETILLLAMGDAVGAEQGFLSVHVQQTSYLTTRECRLAEDLFRAVLQRDPDALEETRSPSGPNRAAMNNLHPNAREIVMQLRISGAARKKVPAVPAPPKVPTSTPVDLDDEEVDLVTDTPETEAPPPKPAAAKQEDIDELHAEMDDLLNDMGLGSDSEEEELDDDDIDLR